MKKLSPILLFFLAAAMCASAAADITLVQDGASAYEIVRSEDSMPVAKFAAKELREFVERSTSATLPIVEAPSEGVPHIYLGASPISETAGIDAALIKPEGFRIKTVGEDIFIVGADTYGNPAKISSNYPVQCGTLNGVYEFLERTLGIVFAWHDDLGTVVPEHATVMVPPMDMTQAPAWSYRKLAYTPEGQCEAVFGRRLRLGSQMSTRHAHAWFRICPCEKYGEEHPEYFALVGGVRRTSYYSGHHGGQVCTSNPDVVEIFAQAAIKYFDDHPDFDMFSVSPNDGGGFCQCESCRALDGGEFIDGDPDRPVLTDRLLAFYNAIAEKLAQKHPDKFLGAYIYSYYKNPPRREKPHPNLYLVNATNSAHMHGVNWEQEHEAEKKWTALTDHFAKYDIYYYGRCSLDLIAPVTTHIAEKIPAEARVGICGGYLYIGQSYEQLGAGHYLMARLMWNPEADVRALEKRYYDALYGPAGADVLAYYHLLEDRLRKMYLDAVDVEEPAVQHWLEHKSSGGSPGKLLAAYWPILDQAQGLIDAAQSRELSDVQARRLERLVAQHDLLDATVRGMIAAGRLEGQASFLPEDVTMLREAVEKREAVKPVIAAYAPTLAKYIEESDRDNTATITPHGAFYQLTRSQKPLTLDAVRTAEAPQIDGAADDPVWQTAPLHHMLLCKSAVPPGLGARARLAFDEANVYVLVDLREEDGSKVLARATDRDDMSLFNDDAVEVFLRPPGGEAYYQIAVGAGGAVYDGAHPTGRADEANPDWDARATAAVRITKTGWCAELAIPLASLGGASAGGAWTGDVFATRRGDADPDEYMAVVPTFGGYHAPQRFAAIQWLDKAPRESVTDGTFDNVPAGDVAKRLRTQQDGGAVVEVATDRAYAGAQSVHIIVPEGGLAGITLDAPAAENTGYRALITYRNHRVTLNPKVRDQAPITRVIFRGKGAKSVTDTKGYSWDGAPALEGPDEWHVMPHVFTTPERTRHISLTIFFHHPGEYWVDEVRLEEL